MEELMNSIGGVLSESVGLLKHHIIYTVNTLQFYLSIILQ